MIDDDNAPLFADVPRHNSSEADEEESTWAFVDRVDDPAIQRVRRFMNTWFARYPVEERTGLRGRLTSGDNVEFHGAWFELYLHELHRRLGFLITVEPTLPAVTTRPDFLLARNEDRVFLEATVIGDRQQAGRAGRIARVVAAVNRTTSPDFKLLFDIEAEGEGSPPMREVRRRLERWLATLTGPRRGASRWPSTSRPCAPTPNASGIGNSPSGLGRAARKNAAGQDPPSPPGPQTVPPSITAGRCSTGSPRKPPSTGLHRSRWSSLYAWIGSGQIPRM